jgi:hypothetical protein
MSPRLLRPRAGGGFHPEAQAWRNAVIANGGTVSGSTLTAVSNFCRSIGAAGIRDRFYRLNLFAGTGLSACLVPLYRGQSLGGTQFGNATDTNANFVAGDYVEVGTTGGLGTGASNATKSLGTGLVPFNAGMLHTDTHMSFYSRNGNTSTGAVMAVGHAVTSTQHWQWFLNSTSGPLSVFYRSGGPNSSGFDGVDAPARTGHLIAQRSGSSAALYRQGVNANEGTNTTNTVAWTTGLPAALRVFARNWFSPNQTTDQFISTTLQSYSLGLSFTNAQALAYHNALQAFQTALGRQL